MNEWIRFRACTCPNTPHDGQDGRDDGDQVHLRPFLGFAAGAKVARVIMDNAETVETLAEAIGPVYLHEAPDGWNLLDEEGEPVPFDLAAVEALPYWEATYIVEACDDAYSQRVLDPLVLRIARLSPSGQTENGSTSATPSRRTKSGARSGRSSRNGLAVSAQSTR